MTWALAIVALTVLVVAAFSRRLTGTPVTPVMLFTLIGVLVGLVFTEQYLRRRDATRRTADPAPAERGP